uniref:Uncharacterized protein n=1 Tax=Glossina austeni TaxID=7395 RepID=A0A1A9V0V3_GLOAU
MLSAVTLRQLLNKFLDEHVWNTSNVCYVHKVLQHPIQQQPICNIVNSQHFPIIEEISPGVILLNGFSGILKVGTELQLLNGTFLVSFHNVSIRVNGKAYTSKEIPTYKALPSILQLMPEEKERKRLVFLHMLD